MKQRLLVVLTIALLWMSTYQISAQETTPSPLINTRLLAYYSYYNIYPEQGEFIVTDIPVEVLTHLHYANIGISDAGQCVSVDVYADTQYLYPGDRFAERLRGNFKQLPILRTRNPNLQIVMSIGGWENSAHFSDVALTEDARARFIRSCITFMQQYDFDGLEIDWRYPVEGGKEGNITRPEDTANLTLLVQELRTALDEASFEDERTRPYLLSMTMPALEPQISLYDVEGLHPLLDYINLMTFGYEGAWSEIAAHMAPLYGSERDPREANQASHSVDGTVRAYLDRGVPADKLVIGVPFSAQAWQNVRAGSLFGLYQPADGVPLGTRDGGTLFYGDLGPFLNNPDYIRYFDDLSLVSWMYNPARHIAISYESPESARRKAAYVRGFGLGGLMAWEVSNDSDELTLMNALYLGLTEP